MHDWPGEPAAEVDLVFGRRVRIVVDVLVVERVEAARPELVCKVRVGEDLGGCVKPLEHQMRTPVVSNENGWAVVSQRAAGRSLRGGENLRIRIRKRERDLGGLRRVL